MTNREMLMEIIAHSKNTNAVMRAAKLQMRSDGDLARTEDAVRRVVRLALAGGGSDDFSPAVSEWLREYDNELFARMVGETSTRDQKLTIQVTDAEQEQARALADTLADGEMSALIRDRAHYWLRNASPDRQQAFAQFVAGKPVQDKARRTRQLTIRLNESERATINILADRYTDGSAGRLVRGMLAWME